VACLVGASRPPLSAPLAHSCRPELPELLASKFSHPQRAPAPCARVGCAAQAVFDLPRRMRAALEEDALETAVEFYADAQPLLSKFGHRGALRAVAADAEAAARDVGAVLKRRLAERRGDGAERAVLLLRRLGEGDDTLQARPPLGGGGARFAGGRGPGERKGGAPAGRLDAAGEAVGGEPASWRLRRPGHTLTGTHKHIHTYTHTNDTQMTHK
jgi:hypothetical protein